MPKYVIEVSDDYQLPNIDPFLNFIDSDRSGPFLSAARHGALSFRDCGIALIGYGVLPRDSMFRIWRCVLKMFTERDPKFLLPEEIIGFLHNSALQEAYRAARETWK